MKQIFILALLALFTSVGMLRAQEIETPNYRLIRQSISNSKSRNYYPLIMRKYLDNDTTLTLEQYRHLYFGFSMQEDYVPYQMAKEALNEVRRRLVHTAGAKSVCPEAIRIAKQVLEDNPFDIPAISTIAISYLQMGDTVSFYKWDFKQAGLLDAILSTGDGASPTTAFHVINIEHEYEVLYRLGLELESYSTVNDHVEYLKVKPNANGEEGFYFDFSACVGVYRRRYLP